MRASEWIDNSVTSLLDVGCNAGAWLKDCARRYPSARLAGIDINESALRLAREKVPGADLRHAGAEHLPFGDATFEYVTCIEVLEHLPPDLRPVAFHEMRRVLQPGGKLILTVPHAGSFAWLDSNNVRLRAPGLYTMLVGGGKRDASYKARSQNVEWHYHFSEHELLALAGEGWETIAVARGGLFLYPLMDWLSWPFYRFGMPNHPVRRTFERIAGWDYRIDFGRASYGILVVLQRSADMQAAFVESAAFAVETAHELFQS